ncbi:tyrosine-type recombinase/integrase [Mycobacterium marinum]|uniref:tyrosine-type recombinase/integrase n=1 Tax=Mycobacterium marinum TaxID=1781 RepID=UPI00234007BB|nr:tyrosine-type recombinase/integrase [Mycobacterium marinum]MDC8995431.1 tyrosine-type recombinase/integrase [Mycobacterium marinum]WDZ16664.1 tyrosine-type recombinase/integrase [Mycobacterium marinum]
MRPSRPPADEPSRYPSSQPTCSSSAGSCPILPYLGEQAVIFPSTAGTLREPNNFGKEWRTAQQELGVAEVTTHSFRKTVATLIDDEGLSARIGADHLGHTHVSMTQDRYMTRGRIHTQVADLLDRTVRINDDLARLILKNSL